MHTVAFRPLRANEQELLARATLGNLNWCGERFTLTDIGARAEFARYTSLIPDRGDFGFVATKNDEALAVVWAQFLSTMSPGYGYVDDTIPELSIWVAPGNRGQGLGRQLLGLMKDEVLRRHHPGLSLSVEAGNHARRLYESEGFVGVPDREADGVLMWLAPEHPLRDAIRGNHPNRPPSALGTGAKAQTR